MPLPNFDHLVADDDYLVDVGQGVWLMDDHRWALKVWEMQRKQAQYTLFHADHHWDAIYDFHDSPEEEAQLVAAASHEVAELVAAGHLIRYDSFIAPAVKRGLIQAVHFYCLQEGGGDVAFNEDFLAECAATQVIHSDAHALAAAQIEGPIIFDLCLDLFNRDTRWNVGDLWSDDEILEFLETVDPLIKRAELVTVSLSFHYSGTKADTRHLARLVLPRILANRLP